MFHIYTLKYHTYTRMHACIHIYIHTHIHTCIRVRASRRKNEDVTNFLRQARGWCVSILRCASVSRLPSCHHNHELSTSSTLPRPSNATNHRINQHLDLLPDLVLYRVPVKKRRRALLNNPDVERRCVVVRTRMNAF